MSGQEGESFYDAPGVHGGPTTVPQRGPFAPREHRTHGADHARSAASLVGRGGFTRFDLHGESVLELGWVVRDALTGRGYATEVGRAALAWATIHEPQTPIVAFTEVHNQASQAVMRRLGMRPAGVIRRTGLVAGRPGLHPDAPFVLYRLEHDDRVV